MTTPYGITSEMVPVDANGNVVAVDGKGFATLLPNALYYFPLQGGAAAIISSVHFNWDAAIIVTSLVMQDGNTAGVALASAVPGDWIPENPAGAYIPVVGGSVSAATVSVAGGAAGGCIYNVGNMGTQRQRFAVQVGATGGQMRAAAWGKA
jgi:hypothetical protein